MVREYLRTLGAASLALTILAIPATDTYRRPIHPPDNGVRCAVFNRGFNEWDFFTPGDIITVNDAQGNTHFLQCGPNGQWIDVTSAQPGGNHANPGDGGGMWHP